MTKNLNNDSSSPTHICLTGGWFSSDNVGDHAILVGILDSISRSANVQFSVITANPKKVTDEYQLTAFSPKKNPIKLLLNLFDSDILMFTGGTPFYDDLPHMAYFSLIVDFAKLFGNKIVIYGVSLRNIKSKLSLFFLKRILNKSTIIGAREGRTLDLFSSLTNKPEKVMYIPDLGLQVNPISKGIAKSFLENIGANFKIPMIGICLRDFRSNRDFQLQHYSREFSEDKLNNYHSSIKHLITHIINEYNYNIVFFPMHTNEPDDDRKIVTDILKTVDDRYKSNIIQVDQQLKPKEMKAMLGLMKAVIGVRFHSIVLATSMNVPTMGICYAIKNQEFMKKYQLSNYSIDLFSINKNLAINIFDNLLTNSVEITKSLRNTNKEQNVIFEEVNDFFLNFPCFIKTDCNNN